MGRKIVRTLGSLWAGLGAVVAVLELIVAYQTLFGRRAAVTPYPRITVIFMVVSAVCLLIYATGRRRIPFAWWLAICGWVLAFLGIIALGGGL